MDEQTRLKARELLLRSRIYRFTALVFAVIGLVVFAILYFKHIDGNILSALQNPALIVMVILPFLPAMVLSRMSAKAEKRFMELLRKIQEPQGQKK